jgi:hypothetical protein
MPALPPPSNTGPLRAFSLPAPKKSVAEVQKEAELNAFLQEMDSLNE